VDATIIIRIVTTPLRIAPFEAREPSSNAAMCDDAYVSLREPLMFKAEKAEKTPMLSRAKLPDINHVP
jgi:hypothetical protein